MCSQFLLNSGAMKNKIALLTLLLLFVFSLANAQNNQFIRTDENEDDYEVEEEFDDDLTLMACSFETFQNATNGVRYLNYKKIMCAPVDGQYMAAFIQGMDENFMIVAISNQGFQEEIMNEKYELIIQYGQYFYYGKIWNEDKMKFEDHILLFEYPQFEMVISIMSPMALSKEKLSMIANQLHF